MRRSAILFALALMAAMAACGPPPEGESPITGGSPSSSGVVASAVHGVVVDAGGRPVEGVPVAAQSLDEPARAVPELAVVTDSVGRFEWPLPAGRYRLETYGGGVGVAVAVTEVVAGEPGPDVRIELPPMGG